MLKSTTYLSLLLVSLSPLLSSCETQSKTESCTYGQDCSHYPRDFVVGQTASGDTSVFGFSWASDGLFSTGDKVEIYTSLRYGILFEISPLNWRLQKVFQLQEVLQDFGFKIY